MPDVGHFIAHPIHLRLLYVNPKVSRKPNPEGSAIRQRHVTWRLNGPQNGPAVYTLALNARPSVGFRVPCRVGASATARYDMV
ncbi:putative wd40 protein [Anopheles sinensis]|uniref:Putative wd40 protein n=1 Tax=Anopheles sinensis TaxID=74873 RepID=A0A084VDP8_ANOSI|nr:putative wd40 protein [Anopheles sinensis]